MPEGRISAIGLNLPHGRFSALRQIPFGWHFVVENDPSATSSIASHAIVGTAFLDRSDLSGIFSITPEPGFTCADIIGRHLLRVTVTLYLNDAFRNYRVDGADLKLVE